MEAIFAALERGAVLLTATRRLARELRHDFAASQRDLGRTVWRTPSILPLDAYLRSLWSEWLIDAAEDLTLLTAEQEALVWARIIRNSPQGETLLQIDATARRAMEAWRLIHACRLPLDGRFQASEDCAAFLAWSREFSSVAERRHWLDESRLPDFLLQKSRAGDIARPSGAWFAGFDHISPQQREFLDEIGAKPFELPLLRSAVRTTVCHTAEDEIRCAAEWTREILERNNDARVGVVVLNLRQLRSKAERIFRDVLQPAAPPAAEPAFHISLGQPLDRYPMIHAALLILEFAKGSLPLARAGMLLRSPYLAGAVEERNMRGSLDAYLRRLHLREVSIEDLRKKSHPDCPVLNRSLWALRDSLARSAAPQTHAAWSRAFSDLLRAMGWPGDGALDSYEHQLMLRWTELLSQFAAFDSVSGPLSLPDAVGRLHGLAAAVIFQFEDQGAPAQISDHLEIAGVRFDHLWVMGLHNEALPAPADPNPFLPIALQWEHFVPKASADLQLESARVVFERLCSSAANITLSFPRSEGDRALSPSPLLTTPARLSIAQPSQWIESIRASADLETIFDETAPPLAAEGMQRGGASLLRDVAACPFRAFAIYRLGARKLDGIEPGLSAQDKGTILHDVLKRTWRDLRSHEALMALALDDLTALIRRHIADALARFGETTNVAVERIRLERLLMKWMDLERRRQPFTVLNVEEMKPAQIGGLQLEIRADRVDELADGRRVILDYKTGDVKAQGWTPPRLDQPQIPLYCVASETPVAAAAFARIQAEGIGLSGVAEAPLPDFRSYGGRNDAPLHEQIAGWRDALVSLAEQFRSGDARVDPKNDKTCDYCAVVPLCRIRERHDL